ncbi:hypothetical protein CAAU_0392 [Caloramator australicus RC3]|uniref:Uncharacterized protein n=1 Tax=Caloramator australicus RC3 TaxID=857293 RepID=G0V4K1_9CLOT|nr:hypothetical protein CAAU_0392 [Caloramator australicus RC3]
MFFVFVKIIPPINIARILKKAGSELKSETSSSFAFNLFKNSPAKEVTKFTAMTCKTPFKLLRKKLFFSLDNITPPSP